MNLYSNRWKLLNQVKVVHMALLNAQTSLEKLYEAKPNAFPTRIPQPTAFVNKTDYIRQQTSFHQKFFKKFF